MYDASDRSLSELSQAMTSSTHDDRIEVLSVSGTTVGGTPSGTPGENGGGLGDLGPGEGRGAGGGRGPGGGLGAARGLGPGGGATRYTYLVQTPEDNFRMVPQGHISPKTDSQKRVARVVMVLATLMLLMSLLLVGVTLSMSDHIDEMGKSYTYLCVCACLHLVFK